jgi:hypothetical protein
MSSLRRALCFMRVVPPLPPLMFATMACVLLAGVVSIVADSSAARRTLVPVLALQVFAVSTGFASYARRGHYDLLLTGGTSRTMVAIAQWMVAAAPGVFAWGLLAVTEGLVTGRAPELMSAGAAAAMWVTSAVPWACTVAQPRFSAAIGWLVVWVMATTLWPHAVDVVAVVRRTGLPGGDTLLEAGGLLLFPVALVEGHVGSDGASLAVVLVAGGAVAAALVWIRRASFPLESGQ